MGLFLHLHNTAPCNAAMQRSHGWQVGIRQDLQKLRLIFRRRAKLPLRNGAERRTSAEDVGDGRTAMADRSEILAVLDRIALPGGGRWGRRT